MQSRLSTNLFIFEDISYRVIACLLAKWVNIEFNLAVLQQHTFEVLLKYFLDLLIYNECIFYRMHKHYKEHILGSKLLYTFEYTHSNNSKSIEISTI